MLLKCAHINAQWRFFFSSIISTFNSGSTQRVASQAELVIYSHRRKRRLNLRWDRDPHINASLGHRPAATRHSPRHFPSLPMSRPAEATRIDSPAQQLHLSLENRGNTVPINSRKVPSNWDRMTTFGPVCDPATFYLFPATAEPFHLLVSDSVLPLR